MMPRRKRSPTTSSKKWMPEARDWQRAQLDRDWKVLADRLDPELLKLAGGSVKRALRNWEKQHRQQSEFNKRVRLALGIEITEPATEEGPPTYAKKIDSYVAMFKGEPALATLFFLIKQGMIPPPNLLLQLEQSWQLYMDSKGALSLEDCFLGPLVRHSGNYSSRKAARFRKLAIALEVTTKVVGNNKTVEQAADEVQNELLHLGLDSETIAKYARQVRWPRMQSELKRRQEKKRTNKGFKRPR